MKREFELCDALAVDTETRHAAPERAAAVVSEIARAAARLGVGFIYKKTDSALRGNVGAEIGALLSAAREEGNRDSNGKPAIESLAFAPAYPKNGRVTKDGVHYVNGVSLDKSVFANDPSEPVRHGLVAQILREQTDSEIINIPARAYREPGNPACRAEPVIEIYDAESDDDLRLLARYLKACDKLRLLAGCAGFAGVLPEIYGFRAQTPEYEQTLKYKHESETGTALLISGSVNPLTFRQLKIATETGLRAFLPSPAHKLNTVDAADQSFISEVSEELRISGKAAIAAASCAADVEATDRLAAARGCSKAEARRLICENLARITISLLDRQNIGALIVFGGDTLYEILRQADISAVYPIREISPGVVESTIVSDKYDFRLVTKSGGFGNESAAADIIKSLSTQDSSGGRQ